MRANRLILIALLLAACGDRCLRNSECAPGLICGRTASCVAPPDAAPTADVRPMPDAGPPADASSGDAADATPETTDAHVDGDAGTRD